jgi:flagella basal body P-ring formation protein FlgA
LRQLLSLCTALLLAALVLWQAPVSAAGGGSLELPVPKVTIYPGDVVAEDLLVRRAFIASTVTRSAVFENPQAVVGKVARRTLIAGQPIPVNAIRDAYAVTQGQAVRVIFRSGGLVITGQAIPLQSGAAGDVISLRNVDSGAVIKGLVEADGTVRVGAP